MTSTNKTNSFYPVDNYKQTSSEKMSKETQSKNINHTISASEEILYRAAETQSIRGKEYNKDDNKERSFSKMATAFNAITGKDLTPAEVCLMMTILKNVRQWTNPEEAHMDSLVDAVSYQALLAEEVLTQTTPKK